MTYTENVRMLRHSAREALTDALSGLGNRRALMVDLERAFAEEAMAELRRNAGTQFDPRVVGALCDPPHG